MNKELKILILGGNSRDAVLMEKELRKGGVEFCARVVSCEKDFLCQLEELGPDIILADWALSSYGALCALRALRERRLDIPLIAVSATAQEENIVEAIKSGARDYVLKSRLSRLSAVVAAVLREPETPNSGEPAKEPLSRGGGEMRLIITTALDGFLSVDPPSGRIVDVNDAYCRLVGYTKEELLRMSIPEVEAVEKPEEVHAHLDHIVRSGGDRFESQHRTKDGRVIDVEISARYLDIEGGRLVAFLRDTTERKRHEAEARLLQAITFSIDEVESLETSFFIILKQICEVTQWVFGQAWVLNEDKAFLKVSSAWYTSITDLERFRTACESYTFAPGSGLPGRVWFLKKPAWIRNVTQDANFPRAPHAREAGLKTGVGIPILAGDEVIAILEFFLREEKETDERLIKLVSLVASRLGYILQRKEAEEKMRTYTDELKRLNKVMMGREVRIIELKREIEKLKGNVKV